MTAEQITILIKDGDIWPESSSRYRHTPQAYFNNYDNDEKYVVSDELFNILNHIFQDKIKFEVDFEHDVFKTQVSNRTSLASPQKEQRLALYNEFIQEQNILLSDIIQGNYYNTIPELIKRTFLGLFFDNGVHWIECLKFQLLKGKPLEYFSFGKQGEARTSNFKFLAEYFETSLMEELYKLATIEKNITYLQGLIDSINLPAEKGLDRMDVAVLCILKRQNIYDPQNCKKAMMEYNKDLSLKQYSKVQEVYKNLRENGDQIKTKFKNDQAADKVISSIKNVMAFLTTEEQEIAKNTVDTIERNK